MADVFFLIKFTFNTSNLLYSILEINSQIIIEMYGHCNDSKG